MSVIQLIKGCVHKVSFVTFKGNVNYNHVTLKQRDKGIFRINKDEVRDVNKLSN